MKTDPTVKSQAGTEKGLPKAQASEEKSGARGEGGKRNIMLVDLPEYARMASKLTAEQMEYLQKTFSGIVDSSVAPYHGAVVKNIGYACLITFSNAVDTLRAGLRLETNVNRQKKKDKEHLLDVKIAIRTDEVVRSEHWEEVFRESTTLVSRINKSMEKNEVSSALHGEIVIRPGSENGNGNGHKNGHEKKPVIHLRNEKPVVRSQSYWFGVAAGLLLFLAGLAGVYLAIAWQQASVVAPLTKATHARLSLTDADHAAQDEGEAEDVAHLVLDEPEAMAGKIAPAAAPSTAVPMEKQPNVSPKAEASSMAQEQPAAKDHRESNVSISLMDNAPAEKLPIKMQPQEKSPAESPKVVARETPKETPRSNPGEISISIVGN